MPSAACHGPGSPPAWCRSLSGRTPCRRPDGPIFPPQGQCYNVGIGPWSDMHPTSSAALTAVLAAILICAGAPSGARAQQQTEPAAPPAAAPPPAATAPPPNESGLSIE